MPNYFYIKGWPSKERRKRTAKRLLLLKEELSKIPKKTDSENIILATWNIREFDAKAYGNRLREAIYYIAEIIDHFDLIAIQEVKEDLRGLGRLIRVLGKWWRAVLTDATEGHRGNKERLVFLYNSRKISFGGLAGEIVIPPIEDKVNKKIVYKPQQQLARTPFIVGFQAGWFKFMLCTVHIIYGEKKKDSPVRIKEIEMLSDFLSKRAKNPKAWSNNLILLGDFNTFNPKNKTFKQIEKNFFIPKQIQKLPSNITQNKHYDQIAFKLDKQIEKYMNLKNIKAGFVEYYKHVFKEEDEEIYKSNMKEAYNVTSKGKIRDKKSKTRYYKTYWRTHQMSDHLPLWVELKIDFSKEYLEKLS